MNQLVPITAPRVPELAAAAERAGMRFLEFSRPTSSTSTRAGPMPAPPMNSWRGARALACVDRRRPAGARRHLDRGRHARARGADVKQRLAAIRHLFDWLVTGQVVPVNPAVSVRGLFDHPRRAPRGRHRHESSAMIVSWRLESPSSQERWHAAARSRAIFTPLARSLRFLPAASPAAATDPRLPPGRRV